MAGVKCTLNMTSGARNALIPKRQKDHHNRAVHSPGYSVGGVPARCARCGRSGVSLRAVDAGKYICVDCLEQGVPTKKVVSIGADLWCRYFAATAEAKQREALLQYLVDRGAAISDSTQKELCENAVRANIDLNSAAQEVRDIAASHGGSQYSIQFGPKPYTITITI